MKRFNQNQIWANDAAGELSIRPLAGKGKPKQRHYTKAVAAIFVVIILHFVSQFIFFQSEKISLETESVNHRSVEIKFENEQQNAEIETEPAAKKPETAAMPETVLPVVQTEPKPAPPSRVVIKKKEPRQSRAERLRRAEKILTGV